LKAQGRPVLAANGLGELFDEPAPYSVTSLEALDAWELMGCELRIDRLPLILAATDIADADMLLYLIRIIHRTIRDHRATPDT